MKQPPLLVLALLVEAVVALWALLRWKRSTYPQRLLTIVLVMLSIAGPIEVWMGIHHLYNLWVSHIVDSAEYIFFVFIFYLWESRKFERQLLALFGIAFILLWTTGKFTFEPFSGDNIYTAAYAHVTQIVMASMLLSTVFKESRITLVTEPKVWVASGVIIYSSGTLLLAALFNAFVESSPELIKSFWPVNWLLAIVCALIFAGGIWCRETQ